MMKLNLKKGLSVFLATAIATSSLLTLNISTVYAGGDAMPPRLGEQGYKGKNQPVYHGHRKQDILNWTPETDEYSEFMRAKVPLQQRNAAFKPTQANPTLNQEVKDLILTSDYGDEFFNPTGYNDQFAQNLFNFWQYVDYDASWHGVVTNPTPDSLYNPEANWDKRDYEFGVLNIPNPAYTNAAHKNGVASLGCIFFPRVEHTPDFVYKDADGRFPIADKLVEIAKYYGYDGYFVNAEESLTPTWMPLYEDFIRAMTSQGLYVQVYASNRYGQKNQASWGTIDYANKDATVFRNWIKDPNDATIAASSLYMNPDPSKAMVDGSVNSMKALGLDPRSTVFNTLEAGQTGFSGTRGALYNTYDANLVPRTGIASLGCSTVSEHVDEQLYGHSGANSYSENRRGDPNYFKYIVARERTWWSGAADAPTYEAGHGTLASASMTRDQLLQAVLNATPDPVKTANDPNRGAPLPNKPKFPGMAAYISERSVIDGSNFYTNFNTGHGMQYFVDGKVSNDNQWANINNQDILPTWQWQINTNGTRLKLDFDYGQKYNAGYVYNQLGGYNGGSSLAIFGNLDAENFINLYKTKLDIKDTSKLNITFNKPSATDVSSVKVGLVFEDAPSKVEYIAIPDSANNTANEWVEKALDLSMYAGRTLAAFGLSITPGKETINNYQLNIGEIKITDGTVVRPAAPTGLKIDKSFDTSEMYISWDLEDYSKVQEYNVYAKYEDGKEVFLGGVYDNTYYIKSLYNPQGTVQILVKAVGTDGREGPAAVVQKDFTDTIKNIRTTANTGYFDLTWEKPAIDYENVKVDVTFNYSHQDKYSTTFAKGTNAAKVEVPIADGSGYTVRISLLDSNGNVITYADATGLLKDCHSNVYEGVATMNGTKVKLTAPTSYDWWHLYAWQNGSPITVNGKTFGTRGVDDLTSLTVTGSSGVIDVVLEDFNGNKSKPIKVPFGTTATGAVTARMFPDPVLLAKVIELAPTVDKLGNIKALDLSGTNIQSLNGIELLRNLEILNLKNCSSLEVILPGTLSINSKLVEINLTGCMGLKVVSLANTSLEKITCENAAELTNMISFDMSSARFDMSEGTPEHEFADGIAKITTAAMYYKIVIGEAAGKSTYIKEIELRSKKIITYKAGVQYNNQRPVAYQSAMPDEVTILVGEGKYNPVSLLTKFSTVRGTDFSTLKGAGFIDPQYNIDAQCSIPTAVFSKITSVNDPAQGIFFNEVDTSVPGTYNVVITNFNSPLEHGEISNEFTLIVKD
ncbi:hypothetical protein G9F72_004980 [Clostridium estertheticum]|uniref:endo-beta-N-acetylglucosaminidase n=1 Tax=Clostridium estertheticum TaxID=238834 RepID=UPI0013E9827B|nr:endo-beta-N-acetylglucosaminidase [Clostridium estertheticum]MBZ9685704.1 hypothetical protein [Clostridium estertheticum]